MPTAESEACRTREKTKCRATALNSRKRCVETHRDANERWVLCWSFDPSDPPKRLTLEPRPSQAWPSIPKRC
eukprot:15439147-Alexandrium_andersonii.AAC.1